ncbi:MAG TPA: hypothetical protein DD412_01030 [Holosporales bacterium]|nr:hypothetical protein [Holosporales bacterium]
MANSLRRLKPDQALFFSPCGLMSILNPIIQSFMRSVISLWHHVAKNPKTERQKEVTYKQEKGYHPWRVKNNYGRRERVENTFYRFKTSFGRQFLSRDENNRENELTIECHLLNKMFKIGKPISVLTS